MLEDKSARERFSIGNSLEEIELLIKKIGYPVYLIPFGSEECMRVKTESELHSKAQIALEDGFWNLVHVIKQWGKYPDEL
jgi:hypothetical protein